MHHLRFLRYFIRQIREIRGFPLLHEIGLRVMTAPGGSFNWNRLLPATFGFETLLLKEVQQRPLYARVATHNQASLRVLQKSGFVVERVEMSPGDDRYQEREEAFLILK